MLSLLLAASLVVAQVPDTAHVVLVATTDVHGRTTGWDYVAHRPAPGGLARVAVIVDSLRRRYPGQVVVLDAGDLLQGDPFATYYARVAPATPHPVVEAMNLVGYDVATPGNHDFDFGVPLFERAVGDAAFPYVSANIFATAGDTLVFPPFRVLQRQGVRVGIAGFTTPGTMVWNRDRLRGKLRVAPIAASAEPTLASLRRLSDVAVVLMHSGMGGPPSYDTAGVGDEDVAASLAALPFRPDIVVVGHSHREIADSVVNGVHFVQPRRDAEGVSVVHVDLRRVAGRWGVARVRGELVRTANRAPSPLLTQRLAAAHAAVQRWVDEPIGEASVPLGLGDARARPTPLHDFVLETLRRRAGADLASGPVFDLRAGFPADTIRRGQVMALYPYDNTLRAVRITGAQLRSYLEWSTRYFRTDAVGRVSIDSTVPGYDFDLVRGARYDIDLRQPVGERIRNLAVRNRPVSPADSFILALNNHRQGGAGGYTMLRGAPVVYDRHESIPDLLVDAIRARGTLDAAPVPPSGWRIVPEVAAIAVRRIFRVAPNPVRASPRDTVLL
ncbi:MAG TPA: bifunctional UDP-sugar hydrolase/5'-nucleotidase, partial [Gemmatimonadales bacterium]|nr:bifunctional UDP-sugar hydrolase/5'-nucleotidase [Gemmatimonadales bacterium]